MPPKVKTDKDTILAAALALVRRQGADALNARALATELNCSTQPIFSHFPTMEAVKSAVLEEAYRHHLAARQADMAAGIYPPYKASGLSYIRFAHEERELFKLLFMRDRTDEPPQPDPALEPIYTILQQNLGLDRSQAELFHLESWIFVHGIATMVATGYYTFEEKLVDAMLTDMYRGLIARFKQKELT